MPRPVNYPNTFGQLSGQVSASLLDQNFNAAGSIINDSASGWTNAAIDTGSANNYIVNLTPPATEYATGFFLSFIPLNQNTGPSSINVNNLGNIQIVKVDGSALTPQVLQPGTIYTMLVVNNAFRIISPSVSVLIGEIVMCGTTIFPANWLACNGNAVSRTQYSALFAAIGTSYGAGDGGQTFNVPNLNNNSFPAGTTVGATGGGTATVALSVANLPPHNHGVNDPSHFHQYASPTATTNGAPPGFAFFAGTGAVAQTSSSVTGITIANTGSGQAFTFGVVPQFVGVNFIIRAF